jgi:hypothetical protein
MVELDVWNPAPPPQPRRTWPIVLVLGVAVALLAVLALAVVRPVLRIGTSTVALAAPASIDGLPKTGDYSSQPVTVFGQHILDVTSATYGVGDVHYAVVAISGAVAGGDPRVLMQTLAPTVIGDDTLDPSSIAHVSRSGVGYTCWQMNGAAPGVTCDWSESGVSGVVVQVGSNDVVRCVDFTDVTRRSLRRG